MSDRDRRAALDFARKSDADRWTQDDIDNLAAFRAAARAEGAAEMREACCAAAEALREGPNTPTIGALVETMRRASPAGLVAVSVDDLRVLTDAAEEYTYRHKALCRLNRGVGMTSGGGVVDPYHCTCGADDRNVGVKGTIDRIRAAVARKEG